jgi:hypothetical protein
VAFFVPEKCLQAAFGQKQPSDASGKLEAIQAAIAYIQNICENLSGLNAENRYLRATLRFDGRT